MAEVEYEPKEQKIYVAEKCEDVTNCAREIPDKIPDVGPTHRVKLEWLKDPPTVRINSPDKAADILGKLTQRDREVFTILHLNAKLGVVGVENISIGTLTASVVHPREVFKGAILNNADSVILSHYHPSGDPDPSSDDIDITKRLIDSGKILDIEVRDHVILGKDKYTSLKSKGVI